ncbi:MAG: bifunctional phosphoribosylaminoimidazolecarboxamide formyltransferase/IMP cyclohydrolase PurH [Flavobacteriales bacterium CG_4_9_14_3_um_filter_40_17]|nr:MAG: bifunctional phosphoribosylaminoimidazolecarboxamide formyltransferase/IMP cyclohydrolase PurH [Flavobacteriales bacterium CG_4_9_14_3_um_filter_40_17]
MSTSKKIQSALISVFSKEGLAPIIFKLNALGVKLYSTGGTQVFIKNLGVEVTGIEEITSYPSILGGRVKTLHPKVFGGILNRQGHAEDEAQVEAYDIPQLDLVIVDLYPFEKTVASGADEAEVIEKIDIGGISLIRAAAKNFNDVLCVSSVDDYAVFLNLLDEKKGETSLSDRKHFAAKAFQISSHYDTAIFNYFNEDETVFKQSYSQGKILRYGENPHQKGYFFGAFDEFFDQLQGKELSYNNLLDVDSAVSLISEFQNDQPTFAILKHNNACGIATRKTLLAAYRDALAGDPVSAFGGVLVANRNVVEATAKEIHKLFCEVVIAPGYDSEALAVLKTKKNLILLTQKMFTRQNKSVRTCLNGVLVQQADWKTDASEDLKVVTNLAPSPSEIADLLFASKICKHTKSNTIVLAKGGQLMASGAGQTSRVDALLHAIEKAKSFGFDLNGAVMASDAFFPFPDCVEIADAAGIKSVIQPGGSIKDQLSIDYCDQHRLSMVFTGFRHFKH